jgi:hypothetical protein
VIAHVVHYFDGEALSGVLYPHAEFDAERMAMLTNVLELYLDTHAQHEPAEPF